MEDGHGHDTQGQAWSDFFLDRPAHGHPVGRVPTQTARLSLRGQAVPIRSLNLNQRKIREFGFSQKKVRPDPVFGPKGTA
jgi:hypothetical protein